MALQGGSAHNAISRQAYASWPAPHRIFQPYRRQSKHLRARCSKNMQRELNLALDLAQVVPGEAERLGVSEVDTRRIIDLGMALPHGVAEMSAAILEGFVETSNNLAIVEIKNQELHIVTSQRSSVMSRLAELTGRVEAIAALAGVAARHTDGYPAWQPDLDSPLLKRSLQVYRVFRSEPVVGAIHAGLECGVLGMKFPDMDMISTGATLVDALLPGIYRGLGAVGQVQLAEDVGDVAS